ncbi:MAG TPA: hypothetical protein DCE41_30455 [Cytophagales bacterium]|nr:hypothetical protein [Cytophagales bacterium]HAA19126.1 hypothetical protein [Cytophagales bacterium]HAP62715.1 hypothetical protein [Cytophagales bacterium]
MNHLKSLRPLGAVLFGLLLGCQPESTTEEVEKPYFDLSGFLDLQVEQLSSIDLQLNKSTLLGEDTDQFSSVLQKEEWDQEFRFFYEVDINQSILLDQYAPSLQKNGGAMITRYSPKETMENGVQWLEIIQTGGVVTQVSAFTFDKNALYTTQRMLEMNFEDKGGKAHLTDYEVKGFQKMVLKDTVNYSIQGTVLYP